MDLDKELIEKAKKVKLLLMDCDGVLTDGRLYFGENGEELKVFDVKDGQGIVNWHKAGFISGIISGRNSKIVERRANELGIKFIKQGSKDKLADFEDILEEIGLTKEEVAYIGDDTPDIPLLNEVVFAVSVSDAVKEVCEHVIYITNNKGGRGAVRELVDLLLRLKQ
jgi:3-deoxy-D-manno-octulosonate 8-phosphate phosphatase (KDO 8-P phosphatase)